MRLALRQARLAEKADEVPVGAVLTLDGKVLAADRNRIRELRDPTAHAEMLVLKRAARRLKNERLGGTILYTTVEPCSMCSGAVVLARVPEVVYATADPKAGAGGSLLNILDHPRLNHRAGVTGGIFEKEARGLLQRFFRKKRRRR
jgi:tRNA(adenine34) deaminase